MGALEGGDPAVNAAAWALTLTTAAMLRAMEIFSRFILRATDITHSWFSSERANVFFHYNEIYAAAVNVLFCENAAPHTLLKKPLL